MADGAAGEGRRRPAARQKAFVRVNVVVAVGAASLVDGDVAGV